MLPFRSFYFCTFIAFWRLAQDAYHVWLVMAFPAELVVCSLPPSRVKELGPGGNGRVAPRPAKPSQRQSPTDEDSLYQEEEEEEEEEEEVGVGAGLSPANSDLRILHRSLQRVCVHVCSCFFTVHLHTCTCRSDVQCVPLCDIVCICVWRNFVEQL